jgi:ElaB/YqjD/DUF883 family membrane-anchored ribosome-binding protein
MPTDLLDDAKVVAKTAQTALVRRVREDHRRARSLTKVARSAVNHRYLDFRDTLRNRPLAALGIGAGIGLGLGLLLWTGYQIERESPAS